ncbi:hypothetical protein A1O3_07895 [Capronia epimyces CBS 606.96]|uniref:Uncharacterized protein n=1 Tax=Capronia epimyces CBS 606.96 TaxID=1182542 RepID=W9XRJ6_9EURO|nr:uncharacterized protein A1O3_07895 [Capronia epimyces CBS 606.96]EXJ79616.1 hypothetical protein A1O3_07895 [Capronia epimyces CBS 606.96]
MACASRSKYMFVEYSAPPQKVEGQKRRRGGPSEVRAHITKEFHRRSRFQRLGALKTTVPLAGWLKSASNVERGEGLGKDQESKEPNRIAMPTQSTDKDESLELKVSPGLRSMLVSNSDPTCVNVVISGYMPIGDEEKLADNASQALAHTWPRTVPAKSRALINPVKSAWLKCAMDSPVTFHAFIYATTLHLLEAYNGHEVIDSAPMLRLSHKIETIKLVNEQIKSLDGPPSDALLMAVTILSVHGSRDDVLYPKAHPISPLAEAQFLRIYGSMVNAEEHVQGIMLLIAQKGGLDRIELYGLADTIALADLYFASKHVRRPLFPWRRPHESLVISGKHLLDPTAMDLDAKLGRGFRYFRSTSAGRQLLGTLESFCEVVTALDHHTRKGPSAPELVDIIEARNCAQHRLVSQLPAEVDMSEADCCVHHASRLATLIFSDMVIFPLPAAQGVKMRLAPMLQRTLEACDRLGCWSLHAPVLLWALTLGAIAASFQEGRTWYVSQLELHLSLFHVKQWSTLESICSTFLWWNPVCGEPGQTLWDEIFPDGIQDT